MKFKLPKPISQTAGAFASFILSFLGNHLPLVISLIVWALVIFAIVFFTTNQNNRPDIWTFVQKTVPGLSNTSSSSPSPSPDPHEDLKRIADTKAVIQESINNKKFGDILEKLQDRVEVKKITEDCCGGEGKNDTIEHLSNLGANVPFDFNQNSELIFNLRTKNPELAEKFIGVAQPKPKEQLVAFEIQPDGKISEIQIAVSWKMYKF